MIHPRLFIFLSIFLFFLPFQTAIKCYAGSRGYINGKHEQNFVNESCDEEMKYCIESYSADYMEVTASCQTLSTSRRILNLCEGGKPVNNSGVITRCCVNDFCNNLGIVGLKAGAKLRSKMSL